MVTDGGARITYTTQSRWCGGLTKIIGNDDEVAKMRDENVAERKNNATSWDKTWRGATSFYSQGDEETFFLDAPKGAKSSPQNNCRENCRLPDPVSKVYALVFKANKELDDKKFR